MRPDALPFLRDLIGSEAVELLSNEFPGRRVYIPINPDRSRSQNYARIVAALDEQKAKIICYWYGGRYIDFPMCGKMTAEQRFGFALRLLRDKHNYPMRELSQYFKISRRRIRQICRD